LLYGVLAGAYPVGYEIDVSNGKIANGLSSVAYKALNVDDYP
jgi:hypothetical protein